MSEFKIDKGVPMPKLRGGPGRNPIYPLGDMEVGDSFLVPGEKRSSLRSAIQMYGKRYGKRFSLRTVDGGQRVWRLS